MSWLLHKARGYIPTMTVVDMGALKLCLLSLGMMMGVLLAGSRKVVLWVSSVAFAVSYLFCIGKFFLYLFAKEEE